MGTTTIENDHRVEEETTPVEQALAGLVRAVLGPEERQLLAAYEAITDPKVRRSLIDLASAAAGLVDHHAAARELEDSRERHRGPGDEDTITLRRVRRLLRQRVGKGFVP